MTRVPLSAEQQRHLTRLLAGNRSLLTPLGRETILDEAGLDAVRARLNFATDARTFASELVRVLQDHGTLAGTGQPALVSLLRWLREEVAGHEEERAFLDGLLAPYGAPPAAPSASPPLPATLSDESASVPQQGSAPAALRLLFLAANPVETQRLRVDEEMRTIKERLREAQALSRYDMEVELALRESDLPRVIMEYGPTLIHFSGHGASGGALVLEDGAGNARELSPQRVAQLFAIFRGRVKGVLFNACWSRGQAEALVNQAGVPWVVGMARPISDTAARDFAAGFYRALGYGESVASAVELGRWEMEAHHEEERETPQLLVGAGMDAESLSY